MGDLLDLADLATWSATQQFAGRAGEPAARCPADAALWNRPHLLTSRRYVNPLYIRPEAVLPNTPSWVSGPAPGSRSTRRSFASTLAGELFIQRDLIWAAKIDALQVVYAHGLRPARRDGLNDFLRREGRGLTQFATWSALVNSYGDDWREWPAELRRPSLA